MSSVLHRKRSTPKAEASICSLDERVYALNCAHLLGKCECAQTSNADLCESSKHVSMREMGHWIRKSRNCELATSIPLSCYCPSYPANLSQAAHSLAFRQHLPPMPASTSCIFPLSTQSVLRSNTAANLVTLVVVGQELRHAIHSHKHFHKEPGLIWNTSKNSEMLCMTCPGDVCNLSHPFYHSHSCCSALSPRVKTSTGRWRYPQCLYPST